MIDCILDAISLQIKSLELSDVYVRREDIIIDLSYDLYSEIKNKYHLMVMARGKDDSIIAQLYGCNINILSHVPKLYFKVSKREDIIRDKKSLLYCSVCGLYLKNSVFDFCPHCGSRLARFHYENL